MLFNKKKEQNELHKELLFQLKGLLNIELGNYLDPKSNLEIFIEAYNGIDIYVYDKDFAYINQYHTISFIPPNFMFKGLYIDDVSLIGHYHSDDLLYLIMNFNIEKKEMFKKIDNYINWKENYIEKNPNALKNQK